MKRWFFVGSLATIILFTGFLTASLRPAAGNEPNPAASLSYGLCYHKTGFSPRCMIGVMIGNTYPEKSTHAEKRHGKSLISEGIAADPGSAIACFFTFIKIEPFFLQRGYSNSLISHSSLRGPPPLFVAKCIS